MSFKVHTVVLLVWMSSVYTVAQEGYEARCGKPGTPADGNYTLKKTDIYTVVYSCNSNKDYRLVGSPERKCQENGSWDKAIPWCDPNWLFLGTYNETLQNYSCNGQKDCYAKLNSIFTGDKSTTLEQTSQITLILRNEAAITRVEVNAIDGEDPGKILSPSVQLTSEDFSVQNCTNINATIYNCSSTSAKNISIEFSTTENINLNYIRLFGTNTGNNCGSPDEPIKAIANKTKYGQRGNEVWYECLEGYTLMGKNHTLVCRGREWQGTAPICSQEATTLSESGFTTVNPTNNKASGSGSSKGMISPSLQMVLSIACVVLLAFLIGLSVIWKRQRSRTKKDSNCQNEILPSSCSRDINGTQDPMYQNIIPIRPNDEPQYAALTFNGDVLPSMEYEEESSYAEPSLALQRSKAIVTDTVYSRIRNPHNVYAVVNKRKKEPTPMNPQAIYTKVKRRSQTRPGSASASQQAIYAQVLKKKADLNKKTDDGRMYESIDEVKRT